MDPDSVTIFVEAINGLGNSIFWGLVIAAVVRGVMNE
jgi:hypothetical protein